MRPHGPAPTGHANCFAVLMLEPLRCGSCPKCRADTVLALRTAQDRNECHCSTCHHVWYEEPAAASQPDPDAVNVKVKPDRRKRPY